jgi:hypothetical protein
LIGNGMAMLDLSLAQQKHDNIDWARANHATVLAAKLQRGRR